VTFLNIVFYFGSLTAFKVMIKNQDKLNVTFFGLVLNEQWTIAVVGSNIF